MKGHSSNSSTDQRQNIAKPKLSCLTSQTHSSSHVNTKYCQQYSFNRSESSHRQQKWQKDQEKTIFQPNHLLSQESSFKTNSDLIQKYQSIYNELLAIEQTEIIRLFLEEIDQNQTNNQKINQQDRYIKKLEEETHSLKALLQTKRDAISKLCQTETYNLNLIEILQKKINNPAFNTQSHYSIKCKQLQTYINEYIQSNNEMKEELLHNYKLIKGQNIKTCKVNDKINQELLYKNQKIQIMGLKCEKIQRVNADLKQKQHEMMMKLQEFSQQNSNLDRQIEDLRLQLKNSHQFQIELTKENKELSSQLDFIREKVNENQNISRDIFQKMQLQSQQTQQITKQLDRSMKEIQNLKEQVSSLKSQKETSDVAIGQINSQMNRLLYEKQVIVERYDQLSKECEILREDNHNLIELIEEKDRQNDLLRQTLNTLQDNYSKMSVEYQQQTQHKSVIKQQLLDLAKQVKFMESTYHKQLNQNEKIKKELHNFWKKQQKDNILKQICLNEMQEGQFSKGENCSMNGSLNQQKNSRNSSQYSSSRYAKNSS